MSEIGVLLHRRRATAGPPLVSIFSRMITRSPTTLFFNTFLYASPFFFLTVAPYLRPLPPLLLSFFNFFFLPSKWALTLGTRLIPFFHLVLIFLFFFYLLTGTRSAYGCRSDTRLTAKNSTRSDRVGCGYPIKSAHPYEWVGEEVCEWSKGY